MMPFNIDDEVEIQNTGRSGLDGVRAIVKGYYLTFMIVLFVGDVPVGTEPAMVLNSNCLKKVN